MQPILGDRSGTSTGRISSTQSNLADPIKFDVKPDEYVEPWLDPVWILTTRDLNDKGLRGGEADEESLQKEQGTSACLTNMQPAHGTRNADLDPPEDSQNERK